MSLYTENPAPSLVTSNTTPKKKFEFDQEAKVGWDIYDALIFLTRTGHVDFYAQSAALQEKEASSEVPLMAVRWDKGYKVLWNPKWLNTCLEKEDGIEEIAGVICHEMLHVFAKHLPRILRRYKWYKGRFSKESFMKKANIAADLAVNKDMFQWYKFNYQEKLIHPKNVPGIPDNLTFEQILDLLLDESFKIDLPGGSIGCFGPGILDQMEKENKSPEEMAREIEKYTEELLYNLRKFRNAGNLPGWLREKLNEELKFQQSVPWHKYLSAWACSRKTQTKYRTSSTPNRRNMVIGAAPFPGKKRSTTWSLMVLGDESGSMTSEVLSKSINELLELKRTQEDVKLFYCPFDAAASDVFEITDNFDGGGSDNGKSRTLQEMFTRSRMGGTDFNPPMAITKEYANRKMIDAVVVFTDGYAGDIRPENIPPVPILWVITESNANPNPGLGDKLYIK